MLIRFLREHVVASVLLFFIRLYLGWVWLTAGWEKVTGDFDATGYLYGALEKTGGEHPDVSGWWALFLEKVAIPQVEVFNFLVAWGELLVGLGLILGCLTIFSTLAGLVMNFAFLLSGTVSSNPEMVLLGILLVVGGMNAGRFGLDYWVQPWLRPRLRRLIGPKKAGAGNDERTPGAT